MVSARCANDGGSKNGTRCTPMKRRLTASKLDLAFSCAAYADMDYEEDPPGRAAVVGTAFHELASKGEHSQRLSTEEEEALAKRFQGWLKHGLPLVPDASTSEAAYALSPDGTVRLLGFDIGRSYDAHGAGPDDICGSVDIVGDDSVIDLKTGSPRVSASESWQLRFAAIVAGVSRAEFHYVSEAGKVKVDAAEYPAGMQHADFELLVDLALRKRDGETPAVYGSHCDSMYCPARTVCGKYREIMGPLVTVPSKSQKKEGGQSMAKFTLESVTRGRRKAPYYIVLYGPHGAGKSTFAAGAPDPIFIGEPGGTDHLDVARFPAPESTNDLDAALESLENDKHDFKTLVLDTADYLEPIIYDFVCREAKVSSIEKAHGGFGKGYVAAVDKWRTILISLDRLRSKRKMNIIILAHSHLKSVRNPLGDDYERYEMKLNAKAAALLKEAPMAVLFANYVSYTEKDEATKRAKAYGDGSRMVYTEFRPAFDAKNRYGLPFELPLSWEDFDAAAQTGEPLSADKIVAEIESLIPKLDAERQRKVRKYLDADRDDATKLAALADRVRGLIRAA